MTHPTKNAWAEKPLGEVCDVLDRLRRPITKAERIAGPYPYYGATGLLDHVAGYIFDEPLVLIGEDGAKWGAGDNSAFSISGRTWVNNHAHVLRPNRDLVLDEWLIYYLNATDLSNFISGMTVPKLNQARMREIPIPLPPLEEQRQIIAVLDAAFEGLARAHVNVDENLKNVRELVQSSIQDAMKPGSTDWVEMSVADTLQRVRVPNKVRRSEYLTQGEFPIVSQEAALINGYWNEATDVVRIERPLVVFGDHTRALKFVDFDFVVGADGTQLMAPIPEIEPDFFYFALRTINLEGKGYARHFSHLKKATLCFPRNISEQKAIACRLRDLEQMSDELTAIYQKKCADIGKLRLSLLEAAFSGGLT